MATFSEAHQARMQLKMKLSNYHWYNSSVEVMVPDGYSVLINVKKIDNTVRKVISPVIGNVEIRTEE